MKLDKTVDEIIEIGKKWEIKIEPESSAPGWYIVEDGREKLTNLEEILMIREKEENK